MIDDPHVARTEPRLTAVIRLTVPREEIRSVMGPAISEVMALAGRQGIGPVGPVFSHHFRIDPRVFDFEVGVPVKAPVAPAGRAYEGLGPAWEEFDERSVKKGLALAPELWESYVAGPESDPDPAQWRTDLIRPLIR